MCGWNVTIKKIYSLERINSPCLLMYNNVVINFTRFAELCLLL